MLEKAVVFPSTEGTPFHYSAREVGKGKVERGSYEKVNKILHRENGGKVGWEIGKSKIDQ